MTPEQIESGKKAIDAMSQQDMAKLWRFAESGHSYFVTGTPLNEYFKEKFKGFTPEISKTIGWNRPRVGG